MNNRVDDPNYYKKHRPEVLPFLPSRYRRVLEIGCGEGRFRSNLSLDCEYHGVEMSSRAAQQALTVLDRVYVGTYDEVSNQIPANYFDLVICNDVIEHMPDHDAFLSRIREKMVSGAFLVGSVPNVRHLPLLLQLLIRKNWQYVDHGVLDRTHLRFFTAYSLRQTLAQHRFDIQTLEGINALELGRGPLRRSVKHVLFWILGRDTRFLQFGFQAKVLD